MIEKKPYTTGHVISADGTRIGYRQMGAGPGVILVHGGIQAAQNFMELGSALANDFTVYIPDRRGRGMSGGFGQHYGLVKDGEDMQALIQKTGAKNIFGLSSGAIITLQTALLEPSLTKVAVYEPPLPVAGVDHSRMDKRYDKAIAKGNLGKGMVSIIKGTGDPSLFRALPSFITAPLINMGIKKREKSNSGGDVPLKDLIPTFHYDRIIVADATDIIEKSKKIRADILLLGGTKSKKFLRRALNELASALPAAKRVTFKGLGHIAASNGEKPAVIAKELRDFFKNEQF